MPVSAARFHVAAGWLVAKCLLDLSGRRWKWRRPGQSASKDAWRLSIVLGFGRTRDDRNEIDREKVQTSGNAGAHVLAWRFVRAVRFVRTRAIHASMRGFMLLGHARKSIGHADAEHQHHREHHDRNEFGPHAHGLSLALLARLGKSAIGAQGSPSSGRFPPVGTS